MQKLKKNKIIYKMYKKIKFKKYFEKQSKIIFPENIKDKEKAVIILAGYKSQLWGTVFKRLKQFIPKDYDVCIVSSGINSSELLGIAEKNGWAYLPLRRNNVCVAINTAIYKLKKAKFFFKIDEDIFLTKDAIKNVEAAYKSPSLDYNPGVVAPLIPVNGFSYVEVLKRFGWIKEYTERFEIPIHGAGPDKQIESNPDVAKFLWQGGNLDEMGRKIANDPKSEIACPIRFSIGMIFFERKIWQDMGYFAASSRGNDMGRDEVILDKFCMINSRPMVISKNALVGHLSFGRQNSEMYKFYEKNVALFDIESRR